MRQEAWIAIKNERTGKAKANKIIDLLQCLTPTRPWELIKTLTIPILKTTQLIKNIKFIVSVR